MKALPPIFIFIALFLFLECPHFISSEAVPAHIINSIAEIFKHDPDHEAKSSLMGMFVLNEVFSNLNRDHIIDAKAICLPDTEIAPCLCTLDEGSNSTLDCSAVESTDQLATIFQQGLSVTQFTNFVLADNPNIIVINDGVFNGVTFEVISLTDDANLALVSDNAFADSASTLRELHVHGSSLDSLSFPFATIGTYQSLETLVVDFSSQLTSLPLLESESITHADFFKSAITDLAPGTFNGVPKLQSVDLDLNALTTLSAGSFELRSELQELYLSQNSLTAVEAGAFQLPVSGGSTNETLFLSLNANQLTEVVAGSFPIPDRPFYLDLGKNLITSIQPGAFQLPATNDSFRFELRLYDNQLALLDEAALGEVFPYVTNFEVSGNPLECGCDIAWLVLNPDYLIKLDPDATCFNDTNIHFLDSDFYETNC